MITQRTCDGAREGFSKWDKVIGLYWLELLQPSHTLSPHPTALGGVCAIYHHTQSCA